MRSLSTALLLLLLASAADAQFPGARARWDPPGWWISGDYGTTRSATLSDKGSASTWLMDKASRWRAGVSHGTRDRAMGLSYAQGDVPMSIVGLPSCVQCRASVTSQTMLATYHIEESIGLGKLTNMTDLGLGAARWSNLRGLDGTAVPTTRAETDLAYGFTLGLGLPLGSQMDTFLMYDVLKVRHSPSTTAGQLRPPSSVGFATLRYGVRIRLGSAQ